MAFFTEWIQNIILFIFIAVLLDMILPRSAMEKYVKIIMSLLLLAVMIEPILKIFSYHLPQMLANEIHQFEKTEDSIKNSIEFKKKEIQAKDHAYILEQMAVQMENMVEGELVEKYGLTVKDLQLSANTDEDQLKEVEKVIVTIGEKENANSVEMVKPVEIEPVFQKEADQPTIENENEKEIIALLSEKWGLSQEKISIHMQGGD